MNDLTPNFPSIPANGPMVEFTLDMLDVGRSHDEAMRGMSTSQQVAYMTQKAIAADAVLVVFPEIKGAAGYSLMVIRGANVLSGAGVDVCVVASRGAHPPIRPRRLKRKLHIEAFLAGSYQEGTHMDMCWGDSYGSVNIRRDQVRADGNQAVYNMRTACTPNGRAFLAANRHLWDTK